MGEISHVEEPLARALVEGGHEIRRQVVCGQGRCDIWDGTTSEIIECKARGDATSMAAAVSQLQRYRPFFFDPQLAVAVPFIEPEAKWIAASIVASGIRIIEVECGICI